MIKPEQTSIRKESKKILKIRAAKNGLSLVDYLENILDFYFEEVDKGKINELDRIKKQKNSNDN